MTTLLKHNMGGSDSSTHLLVWTIRVVLLVYAGFIAGSLPEDVAVLLYQPFPRIVFVALILVCSLYDEVSGILLAVGFIVTLQTFNKYYIGSKINHFTLYNDRETFNGCSSTAVAAVDDDDEEPTEKFTAPVTHTDSRIPHSASISETSGLASSHGDGSSGGGGGFGHTGGTTMNGRPSSLLVGSTPQQPSVPQRNSWDKSPDNTVIKTMPQQYSAQGDAASCYMGGSYSVVTDTMNNTSAPTNANAWW